MTPLVSQCQKCGRPNEGDSLAPEGLDFECSVGKEEGVPTVTHVRDMFDRVVRTIGRRVDEFAATVRGRMYDAAKKQRREPLGRN